MKGGEYTVILDPILAGTFIHEAFGHLSEGDNVYEDKNLQEVMKLGREFGGRILNVYDTGLDKGERGYLVYDDEGVPTEKTYLIREGKLVGQAPLARDRRQDGRAADRQRARDRLPVRADLPDAEHLHRARARARSTTWSPASTSACTA